MIKDEKIKKGGNNASYWHLKDNVKQILQVPITPTSNLIRGIKNQIKNIIGPDNGTTMAIEMGGMPVKAGLMKRDPFKQSNCRYVIPDAWYSLIMTVWTRT